VTIDWKTVRIFVKPGATDMRKQINGLSVIVSEEMKMNVFDGNLFLFCNKHRRILKIIYWETNGFCAWYKRLEKDKFPWPMNQKEATEISEQQFGFLLKGIDFWNAHQKLEYQKVF